MKKEIELLERMLLMLVGGTVLTFSALVIWDSPVHFVLKAAYLALYFAFLIIWMMDTYRFLKRKK